MEIQIKFVGILLMILAGIHIIFPKYFQWEKDLAPLSLINRQMMIVHTFFIALTVLLMGLLCLTSADELLHTHLGKTISLGFGIFWSARLLTQFWGYSSDLWRGKTFETIVHVLFSLLWLYLTALFLGNYFCISY